MRLPLPLPHPIDRARRNARIALTALERQRHAREEADLAFRQASERGLQPVNEVEHLPTGSKII